MERLIVIGSYFVFCMIGFIVTDNTLRLRFRLSTIAAIFLGSAIGTASAYVGTGLILIMMLFFVQETSADYGAYFLFGWLPALVCYVSFCLCSIRR
jgi:hypothetical protein